MYLVLSVHTRVSKQVSVAFYAAWNRHRRLVARLTARTWYDTGRPAFITKRDNSVQSLPAVLQRLAGRCIHRVDVYISPKYARCSVSACCWLLAERVEARALRPLACVSRIVSPVFQLHLRVVCTSRAALKEEKEGTAWNFANRPASAFPHCRPRLPSELCKGAFTSQLSNQSPPSLPPCTKSRYTIPIASASLVQVAHDPYRERVILYTNPANARGVVLHVATIFPNNGHARHFPACSKE